MGIKKEAMSSDQTSFERLIDIGIALSAEKDTNKLMESILLEAPTYGYGPHGAGKLDEGAYIGFYVGDAGTVCWPVGVFLPLE